MQKYISYVIMLTTKYATTWDFFWKLKLIRIIFSGHLLSVL